MSQALLLKDNKLFIRLKEGEFEVSNPEAVHTSPLVQFHRKWNEGDEVECPYRVELIDMPLSKTSWESHAEFQQRKAHSRMPQLARLIPEEKKDRLLEVIKNKSDQLEAEHKARLKGDLSVRSDAQHPSFTESDYKTVSSNTQSCGKFEIKSHYDFEPVESSEPQEKAPCQHMYQGPDNDGITRCIWCRDPHEISAPSESQEEMWKKHIQQEELWDDAISIGESEKSRKSAIHKIMKRFTIRRNGDKD